jgi:hypothetical protein
MWHSQSFNGEENRLDDVEILGDGSTTSENRQPPDSGPLEETP